MRSVRQEVTPMPPNKHAVLSASASHRWLNCNPSARLELEFSDRETSAAAEGTAAHELCEYKLKRKLKLRCERPISTWDNEDWISAVKDVIIMHSGRMLFTFKNGMKLEV